MRRLLPALALIATPAFAQDAEEERDRGFLTALIEDNLSAPGLSVRIDGFEGALSSAASLDRLSISDEEGTWLVLEDVVLDWNRSALLRGRLEVEELTAALIRVERAPLPAEGIEALPDAGASGFSLPEIPVSVDIEEVRADRIELGPSLLGQELALSLVASAQLADGTGSVELEAQRLDGPTGTYQIAAGFDPDEGGLAIDLDIVEDEGGLAATLMQLPGAPAIELTVAGSGPLDAFSADIAIASDGQERLGGTVALTGTETGRAFDVDLGGDVTSLFAPRYQPFFGDDVRLVAQGQQLDAGGTRLDDLRIETQALRIVGEATLGADGWPTLIDVTGQVAATDGTNVTLPTSDAATLRRADLVIRHDADVSEDWRLELTAEEYGGGSASLDEARIVASGRLDRDGGAVAAATAAIEAALEGLELPDPALAEAVGPLVQLSSDIVWRQDQPMQIDDLTVEGAGYALTGDVTVRTPAEASLSLTLDAELQADDFSRYAALAGVDLAGSGTATLSGDIAPVVGSFDLSLGAVTEGLALGIDQVDAILDGETTLAVNARRTTAGTFLDALTLENPSLDVSGRAAIYDGEAEAQGQRGLAELTARLADGSVLDPRLAGEVALAVDLTQDDDAVWSGTVDATAPQGIALSANGALTGEAPDVTFAVSIPSLEPFAPGVPDGLGVTGRAFARDGVWSIDAQANGPYNVSAQVSGPVTGPAPEIAFDATLPDISAVAETGIDALSGPATLRGTLAQTGGAWTVDTTVAAPTGLTLTAQGAVTGPEPTIAITARVPEPQALVPALPETLHGPVTLSGDVENRDDAWRIDLTARAPQDITVRARGPVTGTPRIEIAATVPQVEPFVPGVTGTLSVDGTLAQQGDDWTADVAATGPYGARVTAATVLTQQPLVVDFTAAVADLSQVVAAVPGSLDVSGQARQTDTGWDVDVAGTGPYAAIFDAEVALDDGLISVTTDGQIPDAGALAPQLRGPIDFDVSAAQDADGQWGVDASVDGAQGIAANVEGIATGPDADLDFDLRLANVQPFVPGLSGALSADGRVFQQGGEWAIDVDASGPLGATLDAQGTLTGNAPTARFTLDVPNIGPLLPDFAGPLRVSGTAGQRAAGGFAIDIDATGPGGTQASVDGTIDGTDLNLNVTGNAPLGLANAVIEPRRLSGIARFDLRVAGPPALDSVTGTITTSGAALVLPTLRNGLENIDARIQLIGGRAQVALTSTLETGGRVAVNGPITLSAPFDANLAIDVNATVADPDLYSALIIGQVTVTGPLTGGAVIGGRLVIDEAEISVPSTGLTAIGDLPDIRHLATPRPVQRTLARADQTVSGSSDGGGGGTGAAYPLNLTIDAPSRIFVRGRGLDAELGGRIQLSGTTANPITAGGFELIRGRLDILEQRFDLDEGAITFQGDLIPFIRLVAVTETDTLTASIIVEGPADAIEVTFSSTPEVPQEEILAQIFFGRDLSTLSPLQALQLANSVATLAGRGSGGLLDNLRGEAGLDDLDVTTDEDGNVALRAGKYVSDNVYTDVQINQDGDAEVSLNLDVTPNLTVRGSAGADGETALGLFFEKDY